MVDGDQAFAESYELARHKSPVACEFRDLVLAMRTLDRLDERTKVVDWGRVIAGDEAIYDNSPLEKGRRDPSDASYRLFSLI